MSMKKVMLCLIALALISSAPAMLVNNGGFDINAADWNAAGGGGAWAPAHVTTGGNPGGYLTLQADNSTWSVWYQVGTESLAEWGIPDGITITVSADLIDLGPLGNNTIAGVKIEAWNSALLQEFPLEFTVTSTWKTYSFDYELHPDADSVKLVLTNVNYNGLGQARFGYDNIAITIPGGTPALKPVPALGGELPVVNDQISWTNPDPNNPADTLTADVFIFETDTLLTYDPNLGPDVLEPGYNVVQVADDTTAESIDLSDAGYTLVAGKYYYWAVHITDPQIGVIKGFPWHFLGTGDAPPSDVSAGADQYVWLENGTATFILTGTYVDDGESDVTVEWAEGEHETDPETVVTIHSPASESTQVTVNNTGWFFFDFTVSDAKGSGTDTVNVGVYATPCEAAKQDPSDIPATYPNGHGDLDNDCDTDLEDFAIFVGSWMDCMSEKLGCTQ